MNARPLKIRYTLARTIEGGLDEVLAPVAPAAIQLQDVCALIRNLAFIVEHAASPGSETAKRTLGEAHLMLLVLEG